MNCTTGEHNTIIRILCPVIMGSPSGSEEQDKQNTTLHLVELNKIKQFHLIIINTHVSLTITFLEEVSEID